MYPDRQFLKAVLDASPTMIFVVDDDVRILDCNAAALRLFTCGQPPFQRRGGEALLCLQAMEHPDGCGHAAVCRDCVVRNTVKQAIRGETSLRRRTVLELVQGDRTIDYYALITAAPFDHDGRRLVLLTIEDISLMTELWRIVPICSCCKKIRTEEQSWVNIEDYFRSHWDLRFTHGYCPACLRAQLAGEAPSRHPEAGMTD